MKSCIHNKTGSWLRSLLRLTVLMLVTVFAGPAIAASPDVVISQVYGGGGNSGATLKNDFIELFNSGTSPVSLNGWSVQYASATGTTWAVTNLSGAIQPGQYYLVKEAQGSGGTVDLPSPDATGSIAMSATAGKVALVTSTTALSCGSSCSGNASVRDYAGFGTTANNYEGSGPTPAPSNTTAVLRAGNGCTDSDNNSTDFSAGTPNPRNTATALNACSAPVINGVCGSSNGHTFTSAPTTNLCTVGTASAVSGSGPWTWSCDGSNGGATASCSANKSAGGPFTIFHINDTHARLTPHKWIIPSHANTTPVFEDVGGAAYVAGEMLALTAAKPDSLVIDAGDISEGNPIGDSSASPDPITIGGISINGCAPLSPGGTSSNCGMTQFYQLLSKKLLAQRGRGIDAVVVGNHDVRDASYIANLDALQNSGVPVLSVNVRDIATHQPHFSAYNIVTVNGVRIGILGYTTQASEVGASLSSTLEVADCDWSSTDSSKIHLADYVNELRNNQHVDVVVLVAHIGHSALVDPDAPLLVDNAAAKVPEVVVTGHWHTWSDTVWQPFELNYKTIFTESSSFMKYIGELNVDAAGKYLSAAQHVLRNSDITPDSDVQTFVNNLVTQYDATHANHIYDVVGYTADDLMLDNDMKWWTPDEYPWSGNNTAGQWICDAMRWKAEQLFNQCDLAVEAGGGVRADIPAGPVTFLQLYETFPWSDDTFVRIDMTGQDIINFLKATNMAAGFSSALDVTAVDGVPTSVKFNGSPIDLNHTYTVAINNYMLAHPPGGYTWPAHGTPLVDNNSLVRDGLVDFMQSQHPDQAHAYQVGGLRYHLNGEYSGGYRAVVTMMDDNDTKPTYDAAFVRFLSATPETLQRRGSYMVPADLVNADGSVNAANRLSSQEIYRSFLGFKPGALHRGDIVETWGKASFYGGNPEFVDQEGIYADGVEFKVVGHDDSLAKPGFVSSIGALVNDNYKNHYVKFLGRKTASDTVADQNSQTLKIWDATGYAAASLPGNVNDTLEITGVLTMESYGFRFRLDSATVSADTLPTPSAVTSHVDPQLGNVTAPVTLTATAGIVGGGYAITPSADAQVESGSPTYNGGSGNNLFIQSSTSSYGNERAWLKFDLSSIPAGSTITGATLQLWDWKATGASLPVEVRSSTDDTWTETGINWTNQPASGNVLDTQTLASGTTNVWYNWNVTSFVQGEFGGDKMVSLAVKPVTEGSTDTSAPSYGFDAREYGSNAPVLYVTTQATATSVGNVRFFYRYSADNASWGAWTQTGSTLTSAPYSTGFTFPNGYGYYEFYSVATDNLGGVEPAPAFGQTSIHYTAAPPYTTEAILSLNALTATYDGTAKSVAVSTIPPDLANSVTYNGGSSAPIYAGDYAVSAMVSQPGYTGLASGTLSIAKASATVTLGNLDFTYDGTAKNVTATTNPPGHAVLITYDGSTTPPVNTGSYNVIATISDPNCQGTTSGVMTISAGTAAAVPALGPWGLLAAAAGLGILGFRRGRRSMNM